MKINKNTFSVRIPSSLWILLFLSLAMLSSCQKQEELISFIPVDYPKAPPPPPLSNEKKNVKFQLNGGLKETSMSARRVFMNRYDDKPTEKGFYRKGFDLLVRLDDDPYNFSTLQLSLPINEYGNPKLGKIIVTDNTIANKEVFDVAYRSSTMNTNFPNARLSKQADKFNFNVEMRIESFDSIKNEVSGVIESIVILEKTGQAKKLELKELGFTLVFDHMEVYLDNQLAYEGTTDDNSFWYTGLGTSHLFPMRKDIPIDDAVLSFGPIDPLKEGSTQEKESFLDEYYGVSGLFLISDYTGIAVVDGFAVPTLAPEKVSVHVDNLIENVLIRANFTSEKSNVYGNNTEGYYPTTLIPSIKSKAFRGSFFQRGL